MQDNCKIKPLIFCIMIILSTPQLSSGQILTHDKDQYKVPLKISLEDQLTNLHTNFKLVALVYHSDIYF